MTNGKLMAEAMVQFVADIVSAIAILESTEFGRLQSRRGKRCRGVENSTFKCR